GSVSDRNASSSPARARVNASSLIGGADTKASRNSSLNCPRRLCVFVQDTQPQPLGGPMTTKQRWVLALTSISSLMVALDVTVVSTALSTIRLHLSASVDGLEWTVNA